MHIQRRMAKLRQFGSLLVGALVLACADSGVEKKVLLIGLDGVRVDVLAQAATPTIDSLIAEGTFSDEALTGEPTVSGPSWSSMLIGVWPAKHGVHGNNFEGNAYDSFPDFLTRLERLDSRYGTLAVLDWPPLGTGASGGPLVSDAVDRKINVNGDELGYVAADSVTTRVAAELLEESDVDAAFVYLGNIDVVGHETGSLSDEYRAAIEAADRQVAALVSAIRRRSTYDREDWLILMSTDHGRRDDGGHGGQSIEEQTIFYLAAGPSAVHATAMTPPRIVDVAVTALAHLGVEIDPTWDLDGVVVGLR
ncbi:MAG: alkaline phosphatase family protein [Gemmatimonadota bacterium]|nr:alkaline phosphatase family protein [Gemmatimonadota bacterium]